MGTWGPGLFDNDCTTDIRDSFLAYVEDGTDPHLAKQLLLEEYADMFQDSEDGPLASLALSALLLKAGVLENDERNKALDYLQGGGDLELWKMDLQNFEARKNEFIRLKKEFSAYSQNPSISVVRTPKKHFKWEIGQVFALPISEENASTIDLAGEYFLLYFWGENDSIKGYRTPKVWVKLTQNGVLPKNADDFNELEYVQIACTAMEDRFGPFAKESELPEAFQQEYHPDAWGYLPEYTMAIYESKGNHPPSSLLLLGSFEGIQPPTYNYCRYRSALGAAWRYLEEHLLQCYRLHNLRQALYYNK